MAVSKEDHHACSDCGIEITGVPVVPSTGQGPTQAQVEKLKPTLYLCSVCAKERGLSFDDAVPGT